MSTKNFVSYGDAETLFTGIGNKLSTLKSGLTTLDNEVNGDATVYPYADVITIEDAVPANLSDCTVKIEPVQDLHGYDKPWVGGAGKNKLPMTVDGIKAANTDGTWSGNAYTVSGITFTVETDSDGNVNCIKATGTASGDSTFFCYGSSTSSSADIVFSSPFIGSTNVVGSDSSVRGVVWGTNGAYIDGAEVSFNAMTVYGFGLRVMNGYVIPSGGVTFKPMLRLATESDATFAPYTNICPITGHTEASVEVTDGDETTKTYTLALGDTIYGGTVDFDSGVMTVDRAYLTENSFETMVDSTSSGGLHWVDVIVDAVTDPIVISNMVQTKTSVQGWSSTEPCVIQGLINASQSAVRVYCEETSLQDFKSAYDGLFIVYELAAPTTIQLTPQQIQLLKGTNTLTASTGQISVTVNGVSGAIGALTEEVNDHEERIEVVESKISSYVIVRSYSHLCSLVETNASYEFDIEPDTINGYTALLAVYGANDKTSALLPFITSDATLSVGGKFTLGVRNTTANDIANVNLIYYIVYVKS